MMLAQAALSLVGVVVAALSVTRVGLAEQR
jgi:hypothetical protein